MISDFRETLTISVYKTRDDRSLRNLEGVDEVYLSSSVNLIIQSMTG